MFGLLDLIRGKMSWGVFHLEICLGVRRQMRFMGSREGIGPQKI